MLQSCFTVTLEKRLLTLNLFTHVRVFSDKTQKFVVLDFTFKALIGVFGLGDHENLPD